MPRFRPYDPPRDERNNCPTSGKRMFAEELEAQMEADRIRDEGGVALDVYRCMFCDHWHFTSSSRTR